MFLNKIIIVSTLVFSALIQTSFAQGGGPGNSDHACTIGNLQLNFKDEVTKNLVITAIKEKGYKIGSSDINTLSLTLGFQREEQQQWPKLLCNIVTKDVGCIIHDSARTVAEDASYASQKKRSENILISRGEKVLMAYSKVLGRLTSKHSRVDHLIEMIPNCEDLSP